MRRDREIASRMREMLTRDKVGVKEGFSTALSGDLNRLLGDYFELQEPVDIDIAFCENGEYKISVSACATRIKQFDTTLDVKRY